MTQPTDPGFDLNLVRVLLAVLQEKSVTKAAMRLRMSQPAVSFAMRRLREIIGDPIYAKTHGGIELTRFARDIEEPLATALNSILQTLGPSPFDPLSMRRHLCIALSEVGETVLMPPLLHTLRHEAPYTTIEAKHVALEHIEEALHLGHIDLAVGNFSELDDDTRRVEVMRDRYVCMVWRGNPVEESPLSPEQLATMEHVLVMPTSTSHRAIETVFLDMGITRKIVATVSHFSVVADIIRNTHLAVTLPERVAQGLNRTQEFRLLGLPPRVPDFRVTAHWNARLENDSVNRWLRNMVARVLEEPKPEPSTHVIEYDGP